MVPLDRILLKSILFYISKMIIKIVRASISIQFDSIQSYSISGKQGHVTTVSLKHASKEDTEGHFLSGSSKSFAYPSWKLHRVNWGTLYNMM